MMKSVKSIPWGKMILWFVVISLAVGLGAGWAASGYAAAKNAVAKKP